jgi:3-methyladenine DNA glycosylase AlkD
MSQYEAVIKKLKSLSNPKNVEGMARFGINPAKTLGISIPALRKMAKEIGKDHYLAQDLWSSEFHEARILASMIDEPEKVTEKQMDDWVAGFDSWDVCDQTIMNLFWLTPFAYDKAFEWSSINLAEKNIGQSKKEGTIQSDRCKADDRRGEGTYNEVRNQAEEEDNKADSALDCATQEEFIKRAGFAMMAVLGFKDKKAKDELFYKFFLIIKKEAYDDRNFVKKAVNWALRQIGKRNVALNKKAVETAEKILLQDSKSAKWIARDAIKELTSEAVLKRLK